MQNLCLGGGTCVVEEGVFLNQRGTVQFMLWMMICVFEGMYWEKIKKVLFELWMI